MMRTISIPSLATESLLAPSSDSKLANENVAVVVPFDSKA